jgi:signal transduction histidine kinase
LLLALAAAARILEHYFGSSSLGVAAALLTAILLLFLAASTLLSRSVVSPVSGSTQANGSPRFVPFPASVPPPAPVAPPTSSPPPSHVALSANALAPGTHSSPRAKRLAHAYFALQSTLIVVLLGLPPHADFVTALFVALALQAALVFAGRTLAVWIALLALLTVVPALFVFGALLGLALTLIPAVACVVLPAFVVAYQEIEAARLESQRLLDELQAAQSRLQAYADQADALAALETRQRLARVLHDSVSQTLFSLSLNARAARLCLERDPARLLPQLERLQSLSHAALVEIRGLIEHLRPASSVP